MFRRAAKLIRLYVYLRARTHALGAHILSLYQIDYNRQKAASVPSALDDNGVSKLKAFSCESCEFAKGDLRPNMSTRRMNYRRYHVITVVARALPVRTIGKNSDVNGRGRPRAHCDRLRARRGG